MLLCYSYHSRYLMNFSLQHLQKSLAQTIPTGPEMLVQSLQLCFACQTVLLKEGGILLTT